MEKNNGEEITNSELHATEKLLITKGWDKIEFRRINPNTNKGRELLTKVWEWIGV